MKYKYSMLLWLFLIGLPIKLFCQSEQLLVNLTNPKQSGKIIFSNIKGSISVTGYNGELVIIEATPRNFKKDDLNGNGLRKIPTNGFKLKAEENNNEVFISCNSNDKTIDFNIKVPINFSLQLKVLDNGKILINGINGAIEATNINGDIYLEEVAGSAVINTVDGNIKAIFKGIDNDAPMAFTSVQGKIEVFLPSSINANFKMKSEYGEIFSDFSILYDKRKPTVKKKNSISIITLDDWTIGKVNAGGPEYIFNTIEGNIYITKR